jgi:hypothetical protein
MKARFTIKKQSTKPNVYISRISVGVQTFDFGREYETMKEARWYVKNFKTLLKNLDPKVPEPRE